MELRDQKFPQLIACLLLTLVLLMSAPAAYAQNANGQTDVTMVSPLSLVKDSDLNFGNLIAGTAGGTVIVDTDSNRSVSGGTIESGGTVSAARFQGLGIGGQRIRVGAPNGSYTLTHTGGGATMNLRDLTYDVDNATTLGRGNSGQHRITGPGNFTIRVGGTLDVGANQLPGTYTGTFEVRVNYF